ncbi:MAG: hypothetical protein H6Q19_2181, partial [Bacteroidetes bacterium]|nr:hypothetical protein [Bacteroidota bacterium]
MNITFENKITKRILLLIFSIVCNVSAFSQFEAQISQYMLHPAT